MAEVGVKSIPELRQFGTALGSVSEQMVQIFHNAEQRMHSVCEGWNDDNNRKFMEEFAQQVKMIEGISEKMRAYSQYINRTCEILEVYKSAHL